MLKTVPNNYKDSPVPSRSDRWSHLQDYCWCSTVLGRSIATIVVLGRSIATIVVLGRVILVPFTGGEPGRDGCDAVAALDSLPIYS